MKNIFTTGTLLFTLGAAALLTSCGGNSTGFDTIILNGSEKVYLSKGSKNKVTKKSGAVFTSVDKDILTVNGSGEIYIEVDDLDSIVGNGDVVIITQSQLSFNNITVAAYGNSEINMNLTANTLTANAAGEKTITMNGTTDDLKVSEAGNGKFAGFGMKSKTCSVSLWGNHDCEVYVTDALNAVLVGSGNIYYQGNPPSVTPNITGTGQLIKK